MPYLNSITEYTSVMTDFIDKVLSEVSWLGNTDLRKEDCFNSKQSGLSAVGTDGA